MSMEGSKKPAVALTNQERFPLIQDLSLLNRLKQDPYAPVFNFQSGDRLDQNQLEKVNHYAGSIRGEKKFWEKDKLPAWVEKYVTWCSHTVPFYKNRKGGFLDQPTINRQALAAEPWNFVSNDSALKDLLVYQTSGTTGAPMDVLFDPVSQACWIPQLQSILDLYGIQLTASADVVSIALICSQSSTLTYASLSTFLNGAGILKINLYPGDWKDSLHPNQYLEKYKPEVLTGDPFAFANLLKLRPAIQPKALVSSAMKLPHGLRLLLEDYFQCPVLDIYSLTECRMVAFVENGRYRAIRPELYLEVFEKEKDNLLPYGEIGELVITGGNNPFLPLIRYRTGDFCKLEIENGVPYLVDLEARMPVPFYTRSRRVINTIEISRKMTAYPLAGFNLHQQKNYDLYFKGWGDANTSIAIKEALLEIFGKGVAVNVDIFPVASQQGAKTTSYTSDIRLTNDFQFGETAYPSDPHHISGEQSSV